MSLRPVFCLLVSALLLTTVFSSVSSAQRLRSGLQGQRRPLRILGHGWSAGYHWRNPGPNSDYYNPYSAHNSMLKSSGGDGDFFPYGGRPRYSPTGEPNYETLHGDPVEGFEPATPSESAAEPAVGGEATNNDGTNYRRNRNPIRPFAGRPSNDFVPASHLNRSPPRQNSDWSMQDPFDHPSGR